MSNANSNPWSSFASRYRLAVALIDRFGLAEKREMLLGGLEGKILEVGAGLGANLRYYSPDADVTVSEPNPEMLEGLGGNATRAGLTIVQGTIDEVAQNETLQGKFDHVVSTLVLCSVPDVEAALWSISLLVKPGGDFLFLEHVVTPGIYGALQSAATPLWARAADGCHLNRDLIRYLDESPLATVDLLRFRFPLGWPLVPHGIMGRAKLRSDFSAGPAKS